MISATGTNNNPPVGIRDAIGGKNNDSAGSRNRRARRCAPAVGLRGMDAPHQVQGGSGTSAKAKAVIVDAKQRLTTASQISHETKDASGQIISSAAKKVEIKYPDGKGPDATSITAVATSVENIVSKTLDLTRGAELCVSVLLFTKNATTAADGSGAKVCSDMLTKNVDFAESGIKLMDALAENLKTQKTPVSVDQVNAYHLVLRRAGRSAAGSEMEPQKKSIRGVSATHSRTVPPISTSSFGVPARIEG
jgi:hypothetical protein